MIKPLYVPIVATDLTGQKRVRARRVPMESTVGDLVQELLPRLKLPFQDSEGRPLTYHARVNRLGRHAHSSEVVGDLLEPNDVIALHPNVDAGGGG